MSACDLCKLEGLKHGIPKADDPSEQVCYANRLDGASGTCINPRPAVGQRLAGLWRAHGTLQRYFRQDGFNGAWIEPSPADVRCIAEAYGEPWDELTVDALTQWLSGFRDRLPKPKGGK